MKEKLIVLFVIFGQALLAQKFSGFYIEPTIDTKLHTNTKSRLPPTLETQYFTIKPRQYVFPIGFALGLSFGYCFKNNDKLQFGFAQDQVTQGYDAYGISIVTSTPNPLYGHAISGGYGGTSCTSMNLIYKCSILNIKSNWFNEGRFVRVHLNFGLSYLYKPNNGLENFTGTGGLSWTAPDSSRITVQSTKWNAPQSFKRSFKGLIGLDFTFGKNDKEKFCFNISFISNKGGRSGATFGYTDIEAFVTKNNKTIKYTYAIYGTGNGLYFTLSKRIYPLKIYKNRMDKKLEKFKQSQS